VKKLNLLKLPSTKVSRWYISLDFYWEIIGVGIIPGAYSETMSYQYSDFNWIDGQTLWIKWLLIKFSTFGVLYVFLKVISQIFKHYSIKALKLWQILSICVAGGLLNGISQSYLLGILQLPDVGTKFARIAGPIPICTLLILGLSILKSTVLKYRIQRNLANVEIDNLKALRASQIEFLGTYSQLTQSLKGTITSRSSDAIGQINAITTLSSHMDPTIAEKIRFVSDATIRELSHAIEASYSGITADKEKAKQSFGLNAFTILRDSVNFAPLNPSGFAFVVAFITFGSLVRHANWQQAIYMSLFIFTALFLLQYCGILFYRIFRIQNFITTTILLSFNIFIPILLVRSPFIQHYLPNPSKYPPQLIPYLAVVVITTVSGYLMQAGLMRSEDIVRQQKQTIKNVQFSALPINRELVQISRNWARHLHGRVQAQIMAATFSIENAQRQGDAIAVQAALAQINSILNNSAQIQDSGSHTLKEALEECTIPWGGFLEIEMRISPELAVKSGIEILTLADVVEELLANASRHGAATQIRVEIERQDPSGIRIRAIDNGVHFIPGKAGFGSRFFDEVSQGRWDISRNTAFAETTVSVLVPISNNYSFQHNTLAPKV